MVELNSDMLTFLKTENIIVPVKPGLAQAKAPYTQNKEIYLGEAIRVLRKERHISQQELAKRASLNRTTIARIESGFIKSLSLKNMESVAEGLGLDLNSLMIKAESIGESFLFQGSLNKIEFVLDYPEEGFCISSPLPNRKEFFFGKIEMKPNCTAVTKKLPHTEQICLHTMEGRIVLTRGGRDYLLKAGDCSGFSGLAQYELYNPSHVYPATAFFISYPSFV